MGDKHIFISYRSIEQDFMLKLAKALTEKGYPIWVDRLGGILPGDNWQNRLQEGVTDAFAIVPALSRNYLDSKWCMNELTRAESLKIPIVPALISPITTQDTPILMPAIQYADFTNWQTEASFQASLDLLVAGIQRQTNRAPSGTPIPLTIPPVPPKTDRTDPEDSMEQVIEQAKKLGAGSPLRAIKAEALQKDIHLLMEQYKAVTEAIRLELNPPRVPVLKANLAAIEQQYNDKRSELDRL